MTDENRPPQSASQRGLTTPSPIKAARKEAAAKAAEADAKEKSLWKQHAESMDFQARSEMLLQIEEKDALLEDKQKELEEANRKVATLTTERDDATTERDNAVRSETQLRNTNNSLCTDLQAMTAARNNLITERDTLRGEKDSAVDCCQAEVKHNDELEAENAQLKNQLREKEQEQQNHSSKVHELLTQLSTGMNELSTGMNASRNAN